MAIFLDENSRVIVQGMTGSEGQKHTRRMLSAGTTIVGGVNPRKAGTSVDFEVSPIGAKAADVRAGTVSVPVFGTVAEAREATGANVSVVFVPPAHTKSAVIEAVDAGLDLVVIITEGVPVADTAEFLTYAQEKGVRLIGPNCPGIISPGKSNVGITPPDITGAGPIGLVSKSGTLTYQMMFELRDLGFTTCIGIGGDPIIGT
ncbi:MAG TPA: CoA-binding protein, partial [Coriobacteriia bacterium]|nr:CoA-binding protein [Coriobacteriia bacterium]